MITQAPTVVDLSNPPNSVAVSGGNLQPWTQRADWTPIAQPPGPDDIIAHTPDPRNYFNVGGRVMIARSKPLGNKSQGFTTDPGMVTIISDYGKGGPAAMPPITLDLRKVDKEMLLAAAADCEDDPVTAWHRVGAMAAAKQDTMKQAAAASRSEINQQGGRMPVPEFVAEHHSQPGNGHGAQGLPFVSLHHNGAPPPQQTAEQHDAGRYPQPPMPPMYPPGYGYYPPAGYYQPAGQYPAPPPPHPPADSHVGLDATQLKAAFEEIRQLRTELLEMNTKQSAAVVAETPAPQPVEPVVTAPSAAAIDTETRQKIINEALSEIGFPFLTYPPSKPTSLVIFDLGRGGRHCRRYHRVAVSERWIDLYYDTRYEGDQFIPAVTQEGDPPILVTVQDEQGQSHDFYAEVPPFCNLPVACVDIIRLFRHVEPQQPANNIIDQSMNW